ncbi:MAG: hypothetical protein ACW99A_13190 [Candidatus Kariarchaeaceae archaeon]|jgi:hypothetical protein
MGQSDEDDFQSTRLQIKPKDKRHVDLTSYQDYEFMYPRMMTYGVVIILILVYFQPMLIQDVPSGYVGTERTLDDLADIERSMFTYYILSLALAIASAASYSTLIIRRIKYIGQVFNIMSASFMLLLIREVINMRSVLNNESGSFIIVTYDYGLAFYLLIIASLVALGAAYLDYNYSKVIQKKMNVFDDLRKKRIENN